MGVIEEGLGGGGGVWILDFYVYFFCKKKLKIVDLILKKNLYS